MNSHRERLPVTSPRKTSVSPSRITSADSNPESGFKNAVLAVRRFRRLSSSSPSEKKSRRSSAPFPVTAWSTREKQNADPTFGREKTLRDSKSQSEIQVGPTKQSQSWRITLLVQKAKSKFSLERKISTRRISLSDYLRVAAMKKPDADKKRMIRGLKLKAMQHKRDLLAKFRLAVKLTIFCARNFKEHCLRNKENEDELAPYIQRLHFHEEESPDLLIDLSKFKANRQLRISDETKRVLSKELGERTEQELYSVTIALRNIKCIGEYPNRMQKKIAEVGLYERYEAKRVIVRQNHPATGFYFILSGAVVVMVMDMESKYARPVAHLYKGQTFGELAIINRSVRNSTVICKETCEFLSISVQDYHKIFMAGGVKNINDPDQEIFLKSLSCLSDWPIHLMQEHPNKCQFLFFKNSEVIVRDSHYSEWIIIVKSGSVHVLKKLKKVEAFEWKKKQTLEQVNGKQKRDIVVKRMQWRKVLPELRIPLNGNRDYDNVDVLSNGQRIPFIHPEQDQENQSTQKKHQVPNLWPFHVDISQIEYGQYLDDSYRLPFNKSFDFSQGKPSNTSQPAAPTVADKKTNETRNQLAVGGPNPRDRSNSMVQEEESELLGYQPHIRTIMEDIDEGFTRREADIVKPADTNPEFVHVQTLTKGQVYGLADVIMGDQPSFSVISKGADCLLINKQFYLEHASEKLLREMRQELCPYPTEEELQNRLQVSVDWHAYRKATIEKSLESVGLRRHMRTTVKGTKVQEAF